MTDFHISGRPALTKRRLLERLSRVGGVEQGVKERAENSLEQGGGGGGSGV